MGYSHHWNPIKMSQYEWESLCSAVRFMQEKFGYANESVEVTEEYISISGRGETFFLRNGKPQDLFETFCKTNRGTYDTLVVATLEAATYITNKRLCWDSDGNIDDLQDGLELCDEWRQHCKSNATKSARK